MFPLYAPTLIALSYKKKQLHDGSRAEVCMFLQLFYSLGFSPGPKSNNYIPFSFGQGNCYDLRTSKTLKNQKLY